MLAKDFFKQGKYIQEQGFVVLQSYFCLLCGFELIINCNWEKLDSLKVEHLTLMHTTEERQEFHRKLLKNHDTART